MVEEDGSPDLTFAPKQGLFSLHPLVLSMIVSMADHCRFKGGSVKLDGLVLNSSTRYLERMGLFKLMEQETGLPVVEHDPAGRFIPLTRITNNQELTKFVTDFVPLLHATPTEADSVKYVLYELIRNVLEHAGAVDRGAIAAAQVTSTGRLLIGVADSGIGVCKSLSRSHPVTDHKSAIELAFQPGVTGTTARFGGNETNGGAGLFFMKAMSTLARHHMVMVTGDQMMKLLTQPKHKNGSTPAIKSKLEDDRVRWREMPFMYSGTAVGVDITVKETLAFSDLLKEIREVYHVNVRKSTRQRNKARFV
ncbi:ATP-binding protein [Pseudarthrobacter sp. PS3-L1]|uniref:ATP-binding protein n=1 Tax=Pseudarthrobacter sp. PS3-L1 TaxID=3046207 RepID=UPI0024BAAC80|nr:ATP-binding protein [Pseudarthrobacter sp. PS3-L1]MDJ0321974.1 ATP-binding protein [Pseudarthrobacter sp. PS3-L1]